MSDKSKESVEETQAQLEAKREELKALREKQGVEPKPVSGIQTPPSHIGHSRTHKGHTYKSQTTQVVPTPRGQGSRWELGISESEALAELERVRIPMGSLEEFLSEAIEQNNKRFFAHCERAGDLGGSATKKDHWSPCFTFAAILLGHRDLRDLGAKELYQRVDKIIGSDGWSRLPDCDVWDHDVDPREDLVDSWRKVQKPFYLTISPDRAVPLADRYPLTCEDWPGEDWGNYRRTVSFCYWFSQLLNRDGEFFLSCRKAEDLLGVSYNRQARFLRRAAEEDLVLDLLKSGTGDKGSEYRFDYERVTFASD